MTDHFLITPPPELVKSWLDEPEFTNGLQTFEVVTITTTKLQIIATQAARWGADQELEECVSYVDNNFSSNKARTLRAVRRSKPPSLKEQALKELKDWTDEKHGPGGEVFICEGLSVSTIRRALEQLDD